LQHKTIEAELTIFFYFTTVNYRSRVWSIDFSMADK